MLMAPPAPVQLPIKRLPLHADLNAAAHPAKAGSCMGAQRTSTPFIG
jgi:hypothetical protein